MTVEGVLEALMGRIVPMKCGANNTFPFFNNLHVTLCNGFSQQPEEDSAHPLEWMVLFIPHCTPPPPLPPSAWPAFQLPPPAPLGARLFSVRGAFSTLCVCRLAVQGDYQPAGAALNGLAITCGISALPVPNCFLEFTSMITS